MMPDDGREQIKDHDAIYFGAVGSPDVPDHISLWGLRLAICQPFDQYANVRPARVLPGITSPLRRVNGPELDWVIVRENSEGEYAGVGGRAHRGLPIEVATDVSIMTRAGVERIFRFAFALARSRPRKLLTIVTKSNAQRHAMVMWDEIGAEVAREFPDVTSDKMLVDAMTMRMTIKPESLDTIVASNLHADILSDLAAALAGSLGIAPTANLNPERRFPSMFEPIHGSAFDIVGKGIANPIGSFWTGAMMLEHLGERGRGRSADARHRARHRQSGAAHAGPWRQGEHTRGHRRDNRGNPRGKRLDRGSVLNRATLPDIGFESYDSMEGLIAIDRGAPPARFASWPGAKLAHAVYPGLLVAGTIALASTWLAQHYTAPVMLFALLFGMAFHFLHEEGRCVAGIEFASRSVLRLGVGLLGVRITLGQIASLGPWPVATVIVGVTTTILFGFLLARRLGLSSMFGVLSGGAVAICGASAALAIASVLPSNENRERDTIFTVVSVTALSTIAMIIYPVFAVSIGLDHRQAGVFIGGTIHDVAQVVGAGYTISNETGDIATYVKLLRVAMLLPAVFAISFLYARNGGQGGARGRRCPCFWSASQPSSSSIPSASCRRLRSTSPTRFRGGVWLRRLPRLA